MSAALIEALAIAAGGLSSLGSTLIVLLLLNSKAGPRAAFAYTFGYGGAYLVLGLASVYLGQSLIDADASELERELRAHYLRLVASGPV